MTVHSWPAASSVGQGQSATRIISVCQHQCSVTGLRGSGHPRSRLTVSDCACLRSVSHSLLAVPWGGVQTRSCQGGPVQLSDRSESGRIRAPLTLFRVKQAPIAPKTSPSQARSEKHICTSLRLVRVRQAPRSLTPIRFSPDPCISHITPSQARSVQLQTSPSRTGSVHNSYQSAF